jgi:predicted molibdopterin-dependent oxidoreductase YjgC
MSKQVTIFINGEQASCSAAMTVAAAVMTVLGTPRLRSTTRTREPRGIFCGMGTCFDCLVTINGKPDVRACMTRLTDGMRIETG